MKLNYTSMVSSSFTATYLATTIAQQCYITGFNYRSSMRWWHIRSWLIPSILEGPQANTSWNRCRSSIECSLKNASSLVPTHKVWPFSSNTSFTASMGYGLERSSIGLLSIVREGRAFSSFKVFPWHNLARHKSPNTSPMPFNCHKLHCFMVCWWDNLQCSQAWSP